MSEGRVAEVNQSLVSAEHPFADTEAGARVWRVNLVAGILDGYREASGEDADVAWQSAAQAIRQIVVGIARNNDVVYTCGVSAADAVAALVSQWSASEAWVGSSRDGVPGNVFRRVPPRHFPGEVWWPGRWSASGTAMSFSSRAGKYRQSLDRALAEGDLDSAIHLMFVSPAYAPIGHVPSSFASAPSVIDEATFYLMAGAHANCVIGANFYSKCLELSSFLSSALAVMADAGFQCFHSRGLDTFREWATSGKLPPGLTELCPDTEIDISTFLRCLPIEVASSTACVHSVIVAVSMPRGSTRPRHWRSSVRTDASRARFSPRSRCPSASTGYCSAIAPCHRAVRVHPCYPCSIRFPHTDEHGLRCIGAPAVLRSGWEDGFEVFCIG